MASLPVARHSWIRSFWQRHGDDVERGEAARLPYAAHQYSGCRRRPRGIIKNIADFTQDTATFRVAVLIRRFRQITESTPRVEENPPQLGIDILHLLAGRVARVSVEASDENQGLPRLDKRYVAEPRG